MPPLEKQFEKFAARVAPTPAYIIEARATCSLCHVLFNTRVFLASGQNIRPSTICT